MRRKIILNGFSLKTNIFLLSGAIVFAVISSLFGQETPGVACLATGWLLALLAVGPALFGLIRDERMRKGKARYVDDVNTITPGWRQFCQSMGVEEDIRVKVLPNLRNAYASRTTIEVGQPVLDNLDSVSIRAVFAHELAHIEGNHGSKQKWSLFGIWSALFATGMLSRASYSFDLLGLCLFTFSVLLISIAFTVVVIRFISWPNEYRADLIAKQYVNWEAVVSFLTTMAALRKMDVTRDFYGHPSVDKRIANLDWSHKTRCRKWYVEL